MGAAPAGAGNLKIWRDRKPGQKRNFESLLLNCTNQAEPTHPFFAAELGFPCKKNEIPISVRFTRSQTGFFMMVLFEVHLAPGVDGKTSLPDETIQETSAQLMTYEEVINVGFRGLDQPSPGENFIWIAVAKRDAPWIHRSLETNENIINFLMLDMD